jgi:diguanylate cyclase (GGDEF)-like protein
MTSRNVDPLTGLLSRLALADILKSLADESATLEQPTSLLYIDLDHFKAFDDHHGHDAGDVLLCEIGHVIAATCPPPALVSRHGGDEFVVLLSGTGLAAAQRKAEEICAVVRRHAFSRHPCGVTVSIGVATSPPRATWGAGDHLQLADLRLVVAKKRLHRPRDRAWGGILPPAWSDTVTAFGSWPTTDDVPDF